MKGAHSAPQLYVLHVAEGRGHTPNFYSACCPMHSVQPGSPFASCEAWSVVKGHSTMRNNEDYEGVVDLTSIRVIFKETYVSL